ncbi:hypothetical protein [Bradyrhizobium glycinis]|uniref:hypothetical protein n=1 Tax=Bradyrhizobium glycinis TaxID=2751812 RepID=UPI0018D7A679|nr:hypothetical protein [Bradyrhizobium glycinis]MBH5369429.1 hypothetical protein [Bradyrhizobium glycinis]
MSARRPHIVLLEASPPYGLVEVGSDAKKRENSEDYLKLTPLGARGPCLGLDSK